MEKKKEDKEAVPGATSGAVPAGTVVPVATAGPAATSAVPTPGPARIENPVAGATAPTIPRRDEEGPGATTFVAPPTSPNVPGPVAADHPNVDRQTQSTKSGLTALDSSVVPVQATDRIPVREETDEDRKRFERNERERKAVEEGKK